MIANSFQQEKRFGKMSLTFLDASIEPKIMTTGLKRQWLKSPNAAMRNALLPLSRLSDLNE
jgi:hypothetical protein